MTNTIQKLILDYDAKHSDYTYLQAIGDAEEQYDPYDDDDDATFEYILSQVKDEHWNGWEALHRGYKFIKHMETQKDVNWYEIIYNIETMWDELVEEYGFEQQSHLDKKLDIIYYSKATDYFRDWLEKEDFDVDLF